MVGSVLMFCEIVKFYVCMIYQEMFPGLMDNWQFHVLLGTRALNHISDQIQMFKTPTSITILMF